jgi:hypothetical protein
LLQDVELQPVAFPAVVELLEGCERRFVGQLALARSGPIRARRA